MQCIVSASPPLRAVADVVVLAPCTVTAAPSPCPHTAISTHPPSPDVALPDRALLAVRSVDVLD